MSITIIVAALLVATAAVAAISLILRSSQRQLGVGFKLLQDNFESLQRNLLVSQRESERSYDAKSSTLRSEIQETLQNNRKELSQGLNQTTTLLEQKVGAMDQKLENRLQTLTSSVGQKLELNLKEGFLHFEKIQDHLKQAEKQLLHLNTVGQSINDLNNLLKLPHLRGSFGEAVLEQILQDSLPQGTFELQYRIVPNSTERVDAIIHYPNCVLPVDSKFPREQVLALFESGTPEALDSARKQLGDVIRNLSKQIRDKYIHPEHGTTDMALLFVPSETLYFEVLRHTKACDELARNKVFVVSPNTLAVTLHAISLSRRYYEMAQGVETTITEVKKAQQHFKNFEGRFEDVGTALTKAQTAFNVATTHLSRYESAVVRLTGAAEDLPVTIAATGLTPPTLEISP